MKSNIHPIQKQVLAKCVCNNEFYFYSSVEAEAIHIEVCNKCHPCATGKQQVVAVAGRVENFNNRWSNFREKNLQSSNNNKSNTVATTTNRAYKGVVKPVAKHKSVNKSSITTLVDNTNKGKK